MKYRLKLPVMMGLNKKSCKIQIGKPYVPPISTSEGSDNDGTIFTSLEAPAAEDSGRDAAIDGEVGVVEVVEVDADFFCTPSLLQSGQEFRPVVNHCIC